MTDLDLKVASLLLKHIFETMDDDAAVEIVKTTIDLIYHKDKKYPEALFLALLQVKGER